MRYRLRTLLIVLASAFSSISNSARCQTVSQAERQFVDVPSDGAANLAPIYPLDAALAKHEGRVVLRVWIADDGRVTKATVEQSSGHESLDASAIRAVKNWRFKPALRDGKAVEFEILKPFLFKLSDDSRMAQFYLRYHSSPVYGAYERILVVSWFVGKPSFVLRYEVNPSGFTVSLIDKVGQKIEGRQQRLLSADELAALKSALLAIPESKATPPIEHTLYVSFQSNEKWRTESFDTTALPSQLETVIRILGERSETKDTLAKKAD